MNKYPFVPLSEVKRVLPDIVKEGVSKRARSKSQFLDQYKKFGTSLPAKWVSTRNNFIKRTSAQYKKNPTKRRRLALLAWAFDPK
jgi:hypothetical protein